MRVSCWLWNSKGLASVSRPSQTVSPDAAVRTALVLTSLLVLAVPVVGLATGIPLLLLVVLAGIAYLGYLVTSDQLVVGVGTAFFVLLTFNANVPLVRIPDVEHASVFLLDPVLLVGAIIGIYWYWQSSRRIPVLGRVAIGALFLFAGWSVVAAFFGNGPSQLVALLFSLEQLRFALVLTVATLYVMHTDPRCAIYPLLVSIGGHVCFAFVQAVNGRPFGLSYLGEGAQDVIGQVTIGPVLYQAGQHTGGFVGQARVLTGIVILCTPILIVQVLELNRGTLLGVAGASVAGIVVLMSDTDAGSAAFVGTMLVGGALLRGLYWRTAAGLERRASEVTGATGVVTVLLREWDRVTTVGGDAVAAISGFVSGIMGFQTPFSGSVDESTGSSGDTTTAVSNGVSDNSGAVSQGGLVDTSTLGIRLRQYEAAVDIALRNPLFGIGGSNFSIVGSAYGIPQSMSIHNVFLAYLAATGFPGLFLFLISLGAVFALTIGQSVHQTTEQRLLAIGLLMGITGYLAYAFWTTMHDSTVAMATFWAVCGVAIGMGTVESNS